MNLRDSKMACRKRSEHIANTSHQITDSDHQRRKREVRDRRRGYCAQYVIDIISQRLRAVCGRLDPNIGQRLDFPTAIDEGLQEEWRKPSLRPFRCRTGSVPDKLRNELGIALCVSIRTCFKEYLWLSQIEKWSLGHTPISRYGRFSPT